MRLFTKFVLVIAVLAVWAPLVARAATSSASVGTYTSAGAPIAYHRYGRGPVVVVLNGGPGLNALYMEPVAQKIAADGFQAILPDQRGTGLSTASGHARTMLTMAGSVADLEALRVALGQDRLVLVTHSFGGGIALAYAATYPQHVANLILSGSVGTDLSTVNLFAKRLDARLTATDRAQRAAAVKRNDDATQLNIQILTEFDDRARAREAIASLPHPFIYPAISNAIFADYDKHYHVAQQLRAYHGPVTLVTGSDDAALEMEPSLRAAFPHATVVHVAHSGHWPWIENPTVFDHALKTALGS